MTSFGTGRCFRKRYQEHISDIKRPDPDSNYAERIQKYSHDYSDIQNLEILYIGNKGRKLNCIENLHIYNITVNEPTLLLNSQINSAANPIFNKIISIQKSN